MEPNFLPDLILYHTHFVHKLNDAHPTRTTLLVLGHKLLYLLSLFKDEEVPKVQGKVLAKKLFSCTFVVFVKNFKVILL